MRPSNFQLIWINCFLGLQILNICYKKDILISKEK